MPGYVRARRYLNGKPGTEPAGRYRPRQPVKRGSVRLTGHRAPYLLIRLFKLRRARRLHVIGNRGKLKESESERFVILVSDECLIDSMTYNDVERPHLLVSDET